MTSAWSVSTARFADNNRQLHSSAQGRPRPEFDTHLLKLTVCILAFWHSGILEFLSWYIQIGVHNWNMETPLSQDWGAQLCTNYIRNLYSYVQACWPFYNVCSAKNWLDAATFFFFLQALKLVIAILQCLIIFTVLAHMQKGDWSIGHQFWSTRVLLLWLRNCFSSTQQSSYNKFR